MAFIDSSTATSALGAMASGDAEDPMAMDQGADKPDESDEEEEPRQPKPRKDGTLKQRLISQIDDINLARYIDQDELDRIGMQVVRDYELDEQSRSDWVDMTRKAMKFAMQKTQPKQFPWPKASNTIFPLITQATIEFAARTYPAFIQNRSVVKGVVWGSDAGTPITMDGKPDGQPRMTPPGPQGQPPQPVWLIAPGEKRKRADKIAEHMSWQLLSEMPEWEPQTDALLHQIPVTGGAARKTYFDPVIGRNRSLFVSLMDLVWGYHATSFEDAPRHTEKIRLYPHEITELERVGTKTEDDEGMFLPLDYAAATGGAGGATFGFEDESEGDDQSDESAPHFFVEQHRRLDLDDDGYEEPYTVTVHVRSTKVVRIVARYDEEGIEASPRGNVIKRIAPVDHYTLYPFFPSLDGGSYPMGFGHLLKPLNEAINTTLNQMFDAGTLQNAGGGFISDQLGIPSGQTLFSVGKYTRVNTKGGPIRDAVFPIPFPGPSTVLFQLLGVLVSAGKEIASIGNILAGDAAIANAPPTTILALIEQGMKIYTAIHKRLWRAEKSELDKLYRLNRKHIKEARGYPVADEWREITPQDYRLGGGVEPIADPTMTTDMQKLGRAQILMGFKDDPLINQREIRLRLFQAANMDRVDDLFAPPPPVDPMSEMAKQLAIQTAQAELGRTRAAELKDQTQAFLNMALARKNVNAQQEAFIEAQLDFLRLHIEALNTTVKAAAVDHKFHDTGMRATTARAQMAADQASAAASSVPAPASEATPGPTGPFPVESGPGADAPAGLPAPAAGPTGPASPLAATLGAPGAPGRAGGGPVAAGQPYVVGENGPEVIVPQGDGSVVPNMTDRYNTPLSAQDETAFQDWVKQTGRAQDLYDYDLRGAWKAGDHPAANGHLPDTYKKPNHPTFSDESQYSGKDGFVGGHWAQAGKRWSYEPSDTVLQMHGADRLHAYFKQVEPDSTLIMPRAKGPQ